MTKNNHLTVYVMLFLIFFTYIGMTQLNPYEDSVSNDKTTKDVEKEFYSGLVLIIDENLGILDCKDAHCAYPD